MTQTNVDTVVEGVNRSERGVGIRIKELEGWINESQFQDDEWPHLEKGDRINITYDTAKNGRMYAKGEDISVLDGAPPKAAPGAERPAATYADREDGIAWANSVNAAVAVLSQSGSSGLGGVGGEARPTATDIAYFARIIWDARPWGSNGAVPEDEEPPATHDADGNEL